MQVFAPLLGCTSATYPRYAGSCGWGYYKLRTNYDVRAHSGEEIMTPPLAPRSPAYSVINKGMLVTFLTFWPIAWSNQHMPPLHRLHYLDWSNQ